MASSRQVWAQIGISDCRGEGSAWEEVIRSRVQAIRRVAKHSRVRLLLCISDKSPTKI
jgi:hypothetical protein